MSYTGRPSGRDQNQMREITIETGAAPYAEGSCLISFGNTRVLCTASVDDRVPPWLRGKAKGWVTAEYGMLPRATHTRGRREAAAGKQSGRTQEIQRLIGRSLRAVTDLGQLGERQIVLDCDVLQADGGTRTASITGAWVALKLAVLGLLDRGVLVHDPVFDQAAAISCGIWEDTAVCDLDYAEDSTAQTDANFVLSGSGGLIEVQASAEDRPMSKQQFAQLMELAETASEALFKLQQDALK
ncbi:MAG: ribonuclease PH [Robiginitomaculum sp.]|nr:MAG: ribonuclease PH [Robiginitomaculum sp.]